MKKLSVLFAALGILAACHPALKVREYVSSTMEIPWQVGANDFSLDWYSYDEVDRDFGMEQFSVAHDEQWLIPLIKEALRRNPEMTVWASLWTCR